MSVLADANELGRLLEKDPSMAFADVIDKLCVILDKLYTLKPNFKIATVENITGGMLANMISDCPHGFSFFERGMVLLDNKARRECLYVPQYIQDNYHYNSIEYAEAMAKGAIMHTNAKLVVVVSGYLKTRDVQEHKSFGDICIATALRTGEEPLRFQVKSLEKHYVSNSKKLMCRIGTIQGLLQIIKCIYGQFASSELRILNKAIDPAKMFKDFDALTSYLVAIGNKVANAK